MEWLKNLASYSGDLRARVSEPAYQMQLRVADEFNKKQINEAFDQVIQLRQLEQQTPDQFGDEQQLRLFQQMGRAGIDATELYKSNIEELRAQAFERAMNGEGVKDNPYTLGNLANKLDIAPVKHSGGVTYDRFNPTEKAILHMTEAVKANGRLKTTEADQAALNYKVLAGVLNDPTTDPLIGADVANNKEVNQSEQAVMIGKDGKRTTFNRTLQPDGQWRYSPVQDQQQQPLSIPPESSGGSETSLARNMALLAQTMEIPEAEALKILTNTRTKSNGQLYEEAVKMAANSPMTGYGANAEKTQTMANDLFVMMRPNEQPPTKTVEAVNRSQPTSTPDTSPPQQQKTKKNPPPAALLEQAKNAIAKGANPQAVRQRLIEKGYDVEGIL